MTSTFRSVALAGCLLLGCASATQAWHGGYPPFGAWAYGTGFSRVGYFPAAPWRSRTVVRQYGWGGYGNLGFSARTRVAYRGLYRPVVHYRTRYWAPSFPASYTYVAGTSWPRFNCVSPVIYPSYLVNYPILPTYVFPSWSTAGCAFPTVAPTTTFSISYPYLTSKLQTAAQPVSLVQAKTPVLSKQVVAPDVSASSVSSSTLVHTKPTEPPAELLDAADAILRAGGYREAAQAYAQLSVRFGSSHQLLLRRFLARVAGGDIEQAEVIVALMAAMGDPLSPTELASLGLGDLLQDAKRQAATTERMAARALQNPNDATRMKSLATWLALAGDLQRSQLFMSRADQLDTPTELTPEILAAPDIELVSFE